MSDIPAPSNQYRILESALEQIAANMLGGQECSKRASAALRDARSAVETYEFPSAHVISVPWCQCCEAKVSADHICACESPGTGTVSFLTTGDIEMGNWVIHIEGTGAHHNNRADIDANEKAKEFVHELLGIGQTVEAATFTAGGRDSVMPVTEAAAGKAA